MINDPGWDLSAMILRRSKVLKISLLSLTPYTQVLTHFSPLFHFYITIGFLTFSGGIEMEYWTKMG